MHDTCGAPSPSSTTTPPQGFSHEASTAAVMVTNSMDEAINYILQPPDDEDEEVVMDCRPLHMSPCARRRALYLNDTGRRWCKCIRVWTGLGRSIAAGSTKSSGGGGAIWESGGGAARWGASARHVHWCHRRMQGMLYFKKLWNATCVDVSRWHPRMSINTSRWSW